MKRWLGAMLLILAASAIHGEARAAHPSAGNSMIWVGLNGNQAQLVGPTTGAGANFESGELGVHGAYSWFASNQWTVCVSGGYDTGSDQFEPPSGPKQKFSSTSYNVRFGGDRYAWIGDDAALYAGPGLLYWHGRGKYVGSGTPSFDTDWTATDQVGLNGRIGMWARLSGHTALFGHVGQVLAHNSAKDSSGKNTWWSNHHEGSVGLAFDF
jgi:hypothetical protein